MKTRIVHTKFWEDSYILELSPVEKLFFLYLLTNNKINLIGLYELSDKVISFETGINNSRIQEIKEKFEKDNKFIFVNNWVKVVNIERYDDFKGGKLETAKENQLKNIPNEVLTAIKGKQDRVSMGYAYPMHTSNSNSNSNNIKHINLEDNNIKTKAKKILDYWNKTKGGKLRSTKPYESNLEYWLGGGYTLDDIKNAIDNIEVGISWAKDPSLKLLLRQEDSKGPVDRIGECLSAEKKDGDSKVLT